MLHLLADPSPAARPPAHAEAVARLASVRQAMRLVGPFGSGPASDFDDDLALHAAYEGASDAGRKLFGNRSAQLVGATAAGVEALVSERQQGREPHTEASQALVDQIREELARVSQLILA